MKKTSITLLTLAVISLVAFSASRGAETTHEQPPVGRYAITTTFDGIYFLDTATGALWIAGSEGRWQRIESPVSPAPEADDESSKPISLKIPKRGITIPMTQHETRVIPGSDGALSVQLEDITSGQVVVQVTDINGRDLTQRKSLRNGEFLKFKVNKKVVYLQIRDMVNNLLGEDTCKVRLSSKKPKAPKKEVAASETGEE